MASTAENVIELPETFAPDFIKAVLKAYEWSAPVWIHVGKDTYQVRVESMVVVNDGARLY